MTKKSKIIVAIASVMIVVMVIAGLYIKSEMTKRTIAAEIAGQTEIVKGEMNKLEKAESHEEKIVLFSNLKVLFEKYSKTEKPQDKVIKLYEKEISKVKAQFVSGYDEAIKANTISEINAETTKEDLTNKKNALVENLASIGEDKEAVLTEAEYKKYETETQVLVASYDAKLEEIRLAEEKAAKEKAERELAEAKKKEEEARIAKAAEAKKVAQNNANKPINSNNPQANKAPSSSNSNSPSANKGQAPAATSKPSGGRRLVQTTWSTDKDGNKIPGTEVYHYDNGDKYDTSDGTTYNLNNR